MNSMIVLPLFFAAAFGGLIRPLPLHQHGYGVQYAAAVPAAVVHHGVAQVARTQHHSQDSYGNYHYGYSEPNGAKVETRHPDGTVTGSYSHPLPDGRILTNNYVADKYGFRSSLAPTAAKDFSPVVEAAYDVHAPLVQHSVHAVAVPQPPLVATKTVSVAAPAAVVAHHQPLHHHHAVPVAHNLHHQQLVHGGRHFLSSPAAFIA